MAFYPNGGSALTAAAVTAVLAGATIPGALTVSGNFSAQNITGINSVQTTNGFIQTASTGGGAAIDVSSPGFGLQVKEGSNAKQGTATLVAGTVTVANTSVTTNSRILLTTQTPGGTAGFLVVSARVAGTSFTILSSNAADTSVVAYEIFEPG